MTTGRLGLGQLCSSDEKESNFEKVRSLVDEAARQGVDLLSLPECFAYMGARPGSSSQAAEPLSGPLMKQYMDLAARSGMWLALGGFHESPPESDADQRMFNTHVVIDSTGAQRAAYRKAHLYDADAGAAGRFRESATTRPGTCNGAVVHGTPVGVLGLTTCYDVRFPTMYAALRDAGCDVVLVPSAFMSTTGEAHWEVLLRARAIECQFYVGAAAQVGVHKGGRASYGHSMIVDPFGRVAVDAELVEDCVVSADISGSVVRSVREKMPVVSHRRLNVEGVEVFR